VPIAASGKMVSAFHLAAALALGADWCNSARGFMFSLGCIQAQTCHTNQCPVGVATQNHRLERALVVSDKAERVYHFHRNTVEALAEVVAAAGLESPAELAPCHVYKRISATDIRTFEQLYDRYRPGQLLDGDAGPLQEYWDRARASAW